MASNNIFLKSLAVSYLCVSVDLVFGANWDITPRISLGQTYTDNIFLGTDATKRSEAITEISPGFRLNADARAIDLELAYQARAIYYREQDEYNDIIHDLNSRANVILVENFFYLDAIAQINQQSSTRSSDLPPDDNITISNDRVQVTSTSISPYFKRVFANRYQGLLRYRYDDVTYNDDTIAGNQDQYLDFEFNTINARQRILEWRVLYNERKNEFDDGFVWEREHSGAELGFRISDTFTILTNGGYESNKYRPSLVKEGGSYWLAGFRWQPKSRTNLTLRLGERFYGRTGQLEFSHRSKRWTIRMTYDDSFTNSSEGLLGEQDDEGNDSGNSVNPSIVTGVYLERRAELNLNREYGRTNFNFRLFDIDRELQLSTDSETSTGAELAWDWNMTQKSSFNISLRKQTEQILGLVREDKSRTINIGYQYRIGRRGLLDINYRNLVRDSSDDNSDYEQNMYTLNYAYELN